MQYLSLRPTEELLALFIGVNAFEHTQHQDMSRQATFHRALLFAMSRDDKEWNEISKMKMQVLPLASGKVPDTIKIGIVDKSLYDKALARFKKVFKLEKVRTPYFVRIIMSIYFKDLNIYMYPKEGEKKVFTVTDLTCALVEYIASNQKDPLIESAIKEMIGYAETSGLLKQDNNEAK